MEFLNIIINGTHVLFFFVLLVFKFDELSVCTKARVFHAKLSFGRKWGKGGERGRGVGACLQGGRGSFTLNPDHRERMTRAEV